MKLHRVALAGAFVFGIPAAAHAAAQQIAVPAGQVIKACARLTTPELRAAVVCTKKIEVRGGAPRNGYAFEVAEGETLPTGIKLTADGIVTATKRSNPPLPTRLSSPIRFTVSDGTRSKNGTVTLQMDKSAECSCPDLTAGFGGRLPNANGGQPYGLTLPVSGPPSNETVAPTYIWTKLCGGEIPDGSCGIPPGMMLDRDTGVLSGTPRAEVAGHDFVFRVRIREMDSESNADSGVYILTVCPGLPNC